MSNTIAQFCAHGKALTEPCPDCHLVVQKKWHQMANCNICQLAEAYRKALVAYEEAFLLARRSSKTDRHAEAMAMSQTQGAHIVAEANLKIALSKI